MKPELEQKLKIKYPKLFKDLTFCENGDGWYDLIDKMCFSIQNHIDQTRKSVAFRKMHNRILMQAKNGNTTNLKYKLRKLGVDPYKIDNMVANDIESGKYMPSISESPKQVIFLQIKEKFGSLRVYAANLDDYSSGIIRMSENISEIICEECGKPGKKRGGFPAGGWIRVNCENCEENRFKNIKE